MHRLRQLEPSWFRSGQTTSLFESVMEKEPVKVDQLTSFGESLDGATLYAVSGGGTIYRFAR